MKSSAYRLTVSSCVILREVFSLETDSFILREVFSLEIDNFIFCEVFNLETDGFILREVASMHNRANGSLEINNNFYFVKKFPLSAAPYSIASLALADRSWS